MRKIISLIKIVVLGPVAVLCLSLTYIFAGKAATVNAIKSSVRSANKKVSQNGGRTYGSEWAK